MIGTEAETGTAIETEIETETGTVTVTETVAVDPRQISSSIVHPKMGIANIAPLTLGTAAYRW